MSIKFLDSLFIAIPFILLICCFRFNIITMDMPKIEYIKEYAKENSFFIFLMVIAIGSMVMTFSFWLEKNVFPRLRKLLAIQYDKLHKMYKPPFLLEIVVKGLFCCASICSILWLFLKSLSALKDFGFIVNFFGCVIAYALCFSITALFIEGFPLLIGSAIRLFRKSTKFQSLKKVQTYLRIIILLAAVMLVFQLYSLLSGRVDLDHSFEFIIMASMSLTGGCLMYRHWHLKSEVIVIIGSTGTGKSTLIKRYLLKNRKDNVLLDGVELFNTGQKDKFELPIKKLKSCTFLIIDSISFIERTSYWTEIQELLEYRYRNDKSILLVVQSKAELQLLDMSSITSKARLVTLTKDTNLSNASKRIYQQYDLSYKLFFLWIYLASLSLIAITILKPFFLELLHNAKNTMA